MQTQEIVLPKHRFRMLMIALAFFLATGAHASNTASAAALKAGDAAPAITLFDLKGEKVVLPPNYKGKILILHFWASWCSYCSKEMEALDSLYGKYREKGLVPFSINIGQQKKEVTAYTAKLKLSYHVLLDPESTASRTYGVASPPMTFIIDGSGKVRYRILGEVNMNGLERLLIPLMKH